MSDGRGSECACMVSIFMLLLMKMKMKMSETIGRAGDFLSEATHPRPSPKFSELSTSCWLHRHRFIISILNKETTVVLI